MLQLALLTLYWLHDDCADVLTHENQLFLNIDSICTLAAT